jgi:sugar porter (SP) family MFS transporter
MQTRSGPIRTTSGYKALKQSQADTISIEEIESATIISHSTITPYLLYVVFLATLGPFQFGYHLGELNAPQKVIMCQSHTAIDSKSYLPACIPLEISEWGLVQSSFGWGGLLGALFAGAAATKYGRVLVMRILTVFLLLGSLLESGASSMFMLVLGRTLSGIGAGAATVVCPLYVAEVSPQARRGTCGSFTQVMVNTGIMVSQIMGFLFSSNSPWRLILVSPCILSVLTLIGLTAVVETPKWLAANGQHANMKLALRRLRGADADMREEISSLNCQATGDESPLLSSSLSPVYEKRASVTFVEAVAHPSHRRAVIAVVAVFMAQQLTGINSVVMYSVSILGSILPTSAALVSVMVSALNVAVSVSSTPLPDCLGRKRSLLISIAGMGTSAVLLVFGLSRNVTGLTVAALMAFVCSFAMGLGPVPFLLPSELVGSDAVGATSSWALSASWLSTICVAQLFPIFNELLPHGNVYWIFAGIALILGLFIAWQLPETNGRRSPEEVWQRQ